MPNRSSEMRPNGFKKKLKKYEKYRRNVLIAKILSDSISVGPIYLFHLKNKKSVTCQVRTFLNGTFEKFYVIKNLQKYKKIEKIFGLQQYLRIRFLPVQFTYST